MNRSTGDRVGTFARTGAARALVLAFALALGERAMAAEGGVVDPPALESAARDLDGLSARGVDRAVLVGLAGEHEARAVSEVASRAADAAGASGEDGAALVHGRARLLLAACASDPAQRRAEARRARTLLESTRLARTAPEGLRRVSLAAAMWLAGEADPAAAGALPGSAREEAIELIASVLEFPVGTDAARTVPRSLRLEALALRYGLSPLDQREAARREVEAAMDSGEFEEAFEDEVAARFGLALDGASTASFDTTDAGVDVALAGRLLEPLAERAARWGTAPDPGLHERAGPLRERIRFSIERAGIDPAALPPGVRLAWAQAALARGTKPDAARVILRAIAAEQGALAPEALWTQAEDARRRQQPAEAAGFFVEFARRFPSDRRAPEALRVAELQAETGADERLARQVYQQRIGTPEQARAAERLARAMMSGSERDQFARLVEALEILDEARRADAAAAERLGTLQNQLISAFRVWTKEQLAPSERGVSTALALRSWTGAQPGAADRVAIAALLAGEHLSRFPSRSAEARESLGRALPALATEADRHQAIDALARLARPDRPREDAEAVFAILLGVHERATGQPGPRSGSFWHAWAEMLAIMAARNQSGDRTGQIRLRIRQLELIDPALGGAPWAERIGAIESKLPAP
ncbi:MAG: hypothetical protein AB7K52_10075 [Phycisphaerales bacterium]